MSLLPSKGFGGKTKTMSSKNTPPTPFDKRLIEMHGGASPKKFAFARELRENETETEKLLWEELRAKKCEGVKFRRQHPYGRFVLDFYSVKAKLCIEIDGKVHAEKVNADYDKMRTQLLLDNGIEELRFTNEEIKNDMPQVLNTIRQKLIK